MAWMDAFKRAVDRFISDQSVKDGIIDFMQEISKSVFPIQSGEIEPYNHIDLRNIS